MKTLNQSQDCPSFAHPKRASRTSVNYWRDRVENTTSCNGQVNPHYSARIFYKGKRVRFPLETANKNEAAAKAARIYTSLVGRGWIETLKEFKTETQAEAKNEASGTKALTVGDFIQAAGKACEARSQSLKAYVQAFRKIVAELSGIDGKGKQSKAEDGNSKWRARVDAVPMTQITVEAVRKWRLERMNAKKENGQTPRSTIVTVNSSIRNARSLFSKKLLPEIERELGHQVPCPFDGITAERTAKVRYQSRMDAETILQKAAIELAGESPESYKILLLALVCGLRAGEIDHLLWDKWNFKRARLGVESTDFHLLKSENSAGDLDLDESMVAVFKAFAKKAKGKFVIESNSPDEKSKGVSGVYRCQASFDRLSRWLKKQGVTARKPIHELRKEVGSIIASNQGIYAASRYLRHGDIQITASIYADKKRAITPALRVDFK